ncbi:hypothetical protein PJL18_04094 [Paenarthrobacter nicotinovorans]|nr:hypothetical protein [Paenarthrobacter nicotinovorans]
MPCSGEVDSDVGEPFHGPQPAPVRGTHMDHGGAGAWRGDGGAVEAVVEGIGVDPMPGEQAGPAFTFRNAGDPWRSGDSVGCVCNNAVGGQFLNAEPALRAVSVQVDGHIHRTVRKGERLVQPWCWQVFNTAHQLQGPRDPGRPGVQNPVLRKRPPQAPQRRNRHQEVAEFQGAQGKQQGLVPVPVTVQSYVHRGLPL